MIGICTCMALLATCPCLPCTFPVVLCTFVDGLGYYAGERMFGLLEEGGGDREPI